MVDVGLFGPASVTWRVHADPLMGVAGLRALLLQALHPVAMRAVSEHSRFREDPWGRLRDTANYVGLTTFGSTAEALTAGARVRAVHATVHGTDPVTGRDYSGEDVDLLLWVHACLVDSFLDVVRRGGLRLTDAEADAYVAEQVRAAALVGLEPDVVPASRAALAEHLARTRGDLAVTPAARRRRPTSWPRRCPGSSRCRGGRRGQGSPGWRSRPCPPGRDGCTRSRSCRVPRA